MLGFHWKGLLLGEKFMYFDVKILVDNPVGFTVQLAQVFLNQLPT